MKLVIKRKELIRHLLSVLDLIERNQPENGLDLSRLPPHLVPPVVDCFDDQHQRGDKYCRTHNDDVNVIVYAFVYGLLECRMDHPVVLLAVGENSLHV